MNRGRLLPETLATYVKIFRPSLIEVAKGKGIITYMELMDKHSGCPGRGYIGEVLGYISETEHQNRCPLLSAIVVHKNSSKPKDSWRPAQDFFDLAHSLSAFVGNDQDYFYIQELKKVHDYWSSHSVE